MLSDFAKEKVFWTRKMNLNLVKFIESKPNIWNPKHPKYTSVKWKDQTYAEFASKYGNEFTGQAVKDRWTNIRSTYANYLRKLKASRAKGEEYKVNWHLWNACHFLMKVHRKVKDDPTLTGIQIDEPEECRVRYLFMNELMQFFLAKHKFHESLDHDNHMILSEDIYSDQEDRSSQDEKEDSSLNDQSSSVSCKSIADNLLTVLKGVQNDAFGIENTKHGHVGRAVTRKLSQMNSYDAAKVSQKIMEVLLLYDENNPNNPNNVKSEFM